MYGLRKDDSSIVLLWYRPNLPTSSCSSIIVNIETYTSEVESKEEED